MIKIHTQHTKTIFFAAFYLLASSLSSYAQKLSKPNRNNEVSSEAPWKRDAKNENRKELTNLRSRSSKHFEKANGERTMISSAGSMHYQQAGVWKEIDLGLKPNNTGLNTTNPYVNLENQFQTYYPSHPIQGKVVTVLAEGEMNEHLESFYATDANGNVVYQFQAATSPQAIASNTYITYKNTFPMTDVRYAQGTDGRKFDLILQNNQFLNALPSNAKYIVLKEKMNIPLGWNISETSNGIDMYAGNTWVANIPKPIAYEKTQSGKTYVTDEDFMHEGNMSMTKNGTEITLVTKFSIDWLKDASRVFPVNLDPVVNYYPINTSMWTGRMTGPTAAKASGNLRLAAAGAISWAEFDISTLPAGASMTSGKYWGYHYNGPGTPDKLAAIIGMQTVNPVTAVLADINTQITAGTSPVYNSAYAFGGATAGVWRDGTIGGTGLANILAQQVQGWTAFGFRFASGSGNTMLQNGIEIFVSNPAVLPYLQLDYSTGSCSGLPVGGNATASISAACGDPFNLNLTGNSTGAGMVFQWLSSPPGLNTWSLLGASQASPFYSLTQTSARDYRCIVTCTNSGLFDTSIVVSVAQNPVQSCYCIPTGAVTSTNYITSVSTSGAGANISNPNTLYSTTPNPGYADYTSFVVSAIPGAVVVDTIKFVTGAHTIGVWVDWNQDGDFNDVGEAVINTGTSTTTSPFVGSFTVPPIGPNVLVGNTRMRVRTSASGASTACGLSSFGEAEDYTFNVLGPCSSASAGTITPASYAICPLTTQVLTANVALFQTGTSYQWKESATSGGPYVNVVGGSGATTLNYTTPALSAGTYYYILETSCANCGPCSTLSNEIVINVADVSAPSALNSAQCAPGIPTASVSSNAGVLGTGNFNWYNAPTGGTLLQARPFGPVQPYYFNDFTSATLVNSSILPVAAITGGQLILHPNSLTQYGSLLVNASGFNSDKYQVDFDVTTSGTVGSIGEGFSYSFADNANASAEVSMGAENGTGSRLKLGFVANPSGGSVAGIYLMYNLISSEQTPTTTGVLFYSPDVSWINATKHVTLTINNLGRASLLLDATPIFTNIQLPAAYLTANKSTWKHVFKGRTASTTMSTILDNIDIKQSTLVTGAPTYLSSVATTTTFYVSEIGTNGCFSPRVPVVVTVNTPPTLSIIATPNDSVCTGAPVTLTGGGAVNYLWNGNATTVNGDTTFTSAIAGVYTVTGTDANSCSNTTTILIYLHPVLTGTVTATPSSICLGSSTSLSATATPICTGLAVTGFSNFYGPSTWTLSNTNTNGTLDSTGSPANLKLLTGTAGLSTGGRSTISHPITCTGTFSFSWNFAHPLDSYVDYPQYSINGGAPIDFPGYNFNLFGGSQSGTISLSLNDGDIIYFHAVTDDNDPAAGTLTISNLVAPSPKINGSVLFWDAPSGGNNLGSSPATVIPTTVGNSTYYAEFTATNSTACVNLVREPVVVTVNPSPTATVSGGGSVCAGATLPDVSIALTGTSPWDLTYSDGSSSTTITTSTSPYIISNAPAGVYTVSNISNTSCTGLATGSATVTVNPLPTATVSGGGTICAGATLPDVNIALTGNGPWALVYSDGTTSYTVTAASSPYVIPTAPAGTYTVTSVSDANCSGTASGTASVIVNALPTVTASASISTTCNNTTVILNGGGATTYVWSDSRTDATPFVINSNTIFTVTGTDASTSCTASSTVSVIVNAASGQLSNSTPGNTNSIAGSNSDNDNQLAGSFISYYSGSCNLIASIGSTTALGTTTSSVNVEPNVITHNGQPFVARWFQITPTVNTGASVIFYLTQDDFNDYNVFATANSWPLLPTGPTDLAGIANIRVTKNDNTGLGNNPIVLTPGSVTWDAANEYWGIDVAVPGFSQFRFHALNPLNAALPVTITEFTGKKSTTADLLSWTTSQEINNAYFNLQHSKDGIHFTTIEKVNSKATNGNSLISLKYEASYLEPVLGHNYYRLEQVDIDGKKTYHSKIVDLIRGVEGTTASIYPNPAMDILHVDLSSKAADRITFKLMDISGRTVKTVQTQSQVGVNSFDINIAELAEGSYTLQILENNKTSLVQRIVKTK